MSNFGIRSAIYLMLAIAFGTYFGYRVLPKLHDLISRILKLVASRTWKKVSVEARRERNKSRLLR